MSPAEFSYDGFLVVVGMIFEDRKCMPGVFFLNSHIVPASDDIPDYVIDSVLLEGFHGILLPDRAAQSNRTVCQRPSEKCVLFVPTEAYFSPPIARRKLRSSFSFSTEESCLILFTAASERARKTASA